MAGEPEEAIKHFARAMRLSPLDPFGWRAQPRRGAHFFAGRYDEASFWARREFVKSELSTSATCLRSEPLRSPAGFRKRRKPLPECVNSIPTFTFLI